ncbi:MAG: hypothetical protein Q8P51_15360 [Ignavibacteria bacterium]|nr:hypothetical protein [Ignavibacteria bacterium]
MNLSNTASQQRVDPIEIAQEMINNIPTDEDHVKLVTQLTLVCRELALVDETTATFFILERIKPRFNLSQGEARLLLKPVRVFRKRYQLEKLHADQKKTSHEFSSNFVGLVDVVEQDGKPAFLVKNSYGALSIEDKIELNDRRLVPPTIETLPYLLPRADWVMAQFERYRMRPAKEVDSALADELLLYFQESAELSEAAAYHLVTGWAFSTYLMESFQYSPILWLFGAPGHGKTRLGRAMIHVSFRGVHLETLAAGHLIRLATDHHATLFFDVKDLRKKLRQEQTLDLLLFRCERGLTIPRVSQPGKGAFNDMRFYKTFGATLIASNELFDDSAIESRALCLRMPYSQRSLADPVTPELALGLREKLTAFRAWHLGNSLPVPERSFVGRLGDISGPIHQMIQMVKPELWKEVHEFIGGLDKEDKACRADSPDMRILRAVKDLAEVTKDDKLEVREIREKVNNDRDGRPVLSVETVGRKLTALAFHKTRTCNGRMAIYYDRKLLAALLRGHGMAFIPVVPSDPSGDSFQV